jgi:hypothetical protein
MQQASKLRVVSSDIGFGSFMWEPRPVGPSLCSTIINALRHPAHLPFASKPSSPPTPETRYKGQTPEPSPPGETSQGIWMLRRQEESCPPANKTCSISKWTSPYIESQLSSKWVLRKHSGQTEECVCSPLPLPLTLNRAAI